jgi:hypothetical protein
MTDVMVIGGEEDAATWETTDRLNKIGIYPLRYESVANARWFEELKFCGCGDPEGTQDWLQRVLTSLKGSPDPWVDWADRVAVLNSDLDAMRYFVLYVLDAMGLTEHGGSVGGAWLTAKGRKFLVELEADAARRKEDLS